MSKSIKTFFIIKPTMHFVDLTFFAFAAIVLVVFYLLPKPIRRHWLLLASYVFYAAWSIPFIALIIATTSLDYWMSQIIARSRNTITRKSAVLFGLSCNLGILLIFKYSNFVLGNSHHIASLLGINSTWPSVVELLLPLGISFYTFEAISYMVDVYRGAKPAKSWWDYNFYIMYFPHLISGPIIRYHELATQFETPLQNPSQQRIAKALQLILLGYLFKTLLADNAAPLADQLFKNVYDASVATTYIGVLAFTVQIYFDFMGYTHIARGFSLLFNIELPVNFNHPYLAGNISAFWERWHISLSRWIRDYLYFPLGGSKLGLSRTILNLLMTMTICGAWHGAGWNFIAWGFYHGLCLSLYHLLKAVRQYYFSEATLTLLLNTAWYRIISVFITFITIIIGWIFFRANSLSDTYVVICKLFQWTHYSIHIIELWQATGLLLCCFIGYTVVQLSRRFYNALPAFLKPQIFAMSSFLALLIIFFRLITAKTDIPFIYFQF